MLLLHALAKWRACPNVSCINHIYFVFFFFAQESCQNYIRILVQPSPDRLLVCGTNSFRPMCHLYQINTTTYALETEKSGQAVCPYDPQHNSTAVFVGKCSIRLVCFCLHLGRCQLREVMLSNVQRQTYVVIVCVCVGVMGWMRVHRLGKT